MPLRVSNLRLDVEVPEAALPEHLARLLGLKPEAVRRWRILRKSLDARAREALQFVYSAAVEVGEDESGLAARAAKAVQPPVRVEPYQEPPFELPAPG